MAGLDDKPGLATSTGNPAPPKKIGLIGGLAFRAGVFYYDEILRLHSAANERLELVLCHADVGTVLAFVGSGDKAGLGLYLGSLANALYDAGAQLVAVTAIAPHLAIDQIARVARGRVVSALEVVPAGLKAAAIDSIAIFGNRAVMETDLFGCIPPSMAVRLRPPMLDAVHAMYSDIALSGKRGTANEVQFLEEVAREVIGQGAQAILLAGTDLSSFYAEQPPGYPFLDIARLHIEEIVRLAHVT